MSSERPRIGIPVPASAHILDSAASWMSYANAVRQAGGEPVEIALNLSQTAIAKLATSCQGILLPGSAADVNPARYGAPHEPETAAADSARENADELLLQDAHNLYKPLLAICYGLQSLNTWRTGTLVQHLMPVPVNHAAGKSVAVAHTVAVELSSNLAAMLGSAETDTTQDFLRLPVNSSHHQAIGVVGDGLTVVARCPQDGVVEAVEGGNPSHFVLGVQWHPERSIAISEASRRIFQHFVRAAALWKPREIKGSRA